MADLNTNVRYIKGIGETRAKALEKLGVRTLRDLIGFFPRRYEDRSVIYPIAELPVGETACCRAMIAAVPTSRRIPGGRTVVKVRAVDETGTLDVTFFNQAYRQSLRPGDSFVFCGKVEGNLLRRQMVNPLMEPDHAGVSADQGRQPAAAAKGGAAGAGRVPGTAAGRAAGCSAHDPSAVLCQLCL